MANILITGGAGFIGSHLAEALVARGDRVTAIDDESTGSARNLASLAGNPNFTFVRGTLADRELTRRLVAGVDEVYHLAAAVGVRLIASSPIHTIEANVYLTEILLAELRRRQEAGERLKLFLASTSEGLTRSRLNSAPCASWAFSSIVAKRASACSTASQVRNARAGPLSIRLMPSWATSTVPFSPAADAEANSRSRTASGSAMSTKR